MVLIIFFNIKALTLLTIDKTVILLTVVKALMMLAIIETGKLFGAFLCCIFETHFFFIVNLCSFGGAAN